MGFFLPSESPRITQRPPRRRIVLQLLVICLSMATSLAALAQSDGPGSELTVGVYSAPPFNLRDADGQWSGLSVDLWRQLAEDAGYDYRLQPVEFDELLNGVIDGSLDVAIGPLTMTAERETRLDFTHPFFATGLSIGVPHAVEGGWVAAAGALVSWQFFSVILSLAALLLIVGFVVWLFERRANQDEFGGRPIQGIGASFWWAAVTMTTVGYGDKAPRTLGGRLVGLVWMFAALIMVSAFTAAITSALTVSNLKRSISGPQDLRGARVATIAGTASERYLRGHGVRRENYPDLESAIRGTDRGEADAIVYDRPLLQYRLSQMSGVRLDILPAVFEEQNYGFALPSGSPLRERLNEGVLRITASDDWQGILDRYLNAAR